MPEFQPEELLRNAHFLREVDEDDLIALSAILERREYTQGEVIFRQGTRGEAMYFIAEGEVEVLRRQSNGTQLRLAKLEPGDTLGEIEMVFRQPRVATARVSHPTIMYRWDRRAMAKFMQAHPSALSSLRFAAKSRLLAQRLRFRWLADDEVVYGLARKHSMLLYEGLVLPIFMLLGAASLIWWGLAKGGPIFTWGGSGIALVGIVLGIWRWIDWGNDYYVLTDRRAVWLEKIIGIYDSRVEAPLHMVLSVSVSTDIVGRMLGYGDVVIRTYTGRVDFRNIETPHAMAAMIEEHWQRVQAKKDEADREHLEYIVEQRLEPESDQVTPEVIDPEEPTIDEESAPRTGFGRWNFKVRFEEKGVITYRKHWAVLMQEIGFPSFLILLVVGVIGAQVGGLIRFGEVSTSLLVTFTILIPLTLWWIYRYVDWANDIYQITSDQIIDVYKKPLARELRKVAPLENVLGTEVDRKGIIGIILNYGDVITNIGTEQFIFEGVYDPVGVQQDIVHAQEAFLRRKSDRERRRRQDEMVELLDIYHDRYSSQEGKIPPMDEV